MPKNPPDKSYNCNKCHKPDADVFFSVVNGKGRAVRRLYCRACADAEKLNLVHLTSQHIRGDKSSPPPMQANLGQSEDANQNANVSALDLVRQEMAKSATAVPDANESKAAKIKRLQQEMDKAVAKEDYMLAAKFRDQIADVKKQGN